MPLDPEARAFLERMSDVPDPTDENLEQFRAGAAALIAGTTPADICDVVDRTITGGDGQDMDLRIYIPREDGPLPVILWVHGGSFVRGTLDMFDAGRRDFAKSSKCVIVAVDQRLSPEAQFPKPLEDAYAALLWTAENIEAIKGDPELLGVGGESSGGSYEKYAPGEKRKSPLVSPVLQDDFSKSVPAAIVTAEYDPVRDDGERYAESLRASNISVHHERILGHVHHFGGADRTPTLLRLVDTLLSELKSQKE